MRIILSAVVLLLSVTMVAQEHHHSRNEVGISPGAVYSPSHNHWGVGVHAHYFRMLGEHSPWSLGASLEQVSAHGSHWTVSAGAKYKLLDRLNLAVMPGVTFFKRMHEAAHEEDHGHTDKAQFSVHFELVYDLIHWKQFHVGPAFDYSWSKHDNHFMLGVHCAVGF